MISTLLFSLTEQTPKRATTGSGVRCYDDHVILTTNEKDDGKDRHASCEYFEHSFIIYMQTNNVACVMHSSITPGLPAYSRVVYTNTSSGSA